MTDPSPSNQLALNNEDDGGGGGAVHVFAASAHFSDPGNTAQAAEDAVRAAASSDGTQSTAFYTAFAAAPATAAKLYMGVAANKAKFAPAGGFTQPETQSYLNGVEKNQLFSTQVAVSSTSWTATGLSTADANEKITGPWPANIQVQDDVTSAVSTLLEEVGNAAKAADDGSSTPTSSLAIGLQELGQNGKLFLYFAFHTLSAKYEKQHFYSIEKDVMFDVALTAGGVYDMAFLSNQWTEAFVSKVNIGPKLSIPTFAEWAGANSAVVKK